MAAQAPGHTLAPPPSSVSPENRAEEDNEVGPESGGAQEASGGTLRCPLPQPKAQMDRTH